MAGIAKIFQSFYHALSGALPVSNTEIKVSRCAKAKFLAFPALAVVIVAGSYYLWWRYTKNSKTPPASDKNPGNTKKDSANSSSVQQETPVTSIAAATVSSITESSASPPAIETKANVENSSSVQQETPVTPVAAATVFSITESSGRHLLNQELFEQAKSYIDQGVKEADLLKDSHETEPIYFPPHLPIVLKKCGAAKVQERIERVRQLREICEKNGYRCFLIPQVQGYGDFIIESKLPIAEQGTKEQIGLYVEHREQFTEAVKCFTKLLFQTEWGREYITAKYHDRYALLHQQKIGRYDHFALVMENGQGKIALTNFREFRPRHSHFQVYEEEQRKYIECADALCFFPYHFDEIVRISKEHEPTIEEDHLVEFRDKSVTFIENIYTKHLQFVQSKSISMTDPCAFASVSLSGQASLKEAVKEMLRKEHADVWYKNCLGAHPEQTFAQFEKIFPDIVGEIVEFVRSQLNKNFQKRQGQILSNSQLVACRSIVFYQIGGAYGQLLDKIAEKLTMFNLRKRRENNFARNIIEFIFARMATGSEREFAYFGKLETAPRSRFFIFV